MEQQLNDTELYIIKDINDLLAKYINDDPVRPEIPIQNRIDDNKEIIAMLDNKGKPLAIICVCYQNSVPRSVAELVGDESPTIAVFYTIWSYVPGAGKKLIFEACHLIKNVHKTITRFITLSPCTELAKRFHLSNGASVLNVNQDSVNYEYPIFDK